MNELHDLDDRIAIRELREEFTDAVMMNDHERFGSLFTTEGALRIPEAAIDVVGPDQIRAVGVEREALAACFVQNMHAGRVELNGDRASGRAYMYELIQLRERPSHVNYGVYHDRYERTPDGWKFAERVYEVRYFDATPLAGVVPNRVDLRD